MKFRRENEETLHREVDELKKLNSTKDDVIARQDAAISRYEAAVAARTQAEQYVVDLKANYAKQLAIAEKQLAIEERKAAFWRTTAKVGMVAAFILGLLTGAYVNK